MRRTTSLRRVLATTVIVPMVCLVALLGWSAVAARTELRRASELRRHVRGVLDVATARATLTGERLAARAVDDLAGLGLDEATTTALIGTDVNSDLRRSRADVDAVIWRIDETGVQRAYRELQRQRALMEEGSTSGDEVEAAARGLDGALRRALDRQLFDLRSTLAGLDDGELAREVATLVGALDYMEVTHVELDATLAVGAHRGGDGRSLLVLLQSERVNADRTIERLRPVMTGTARRHWLAQLESPARNRIRALFADNRPVTRIDFAAGRVLAAESPRFIESGLEVVLVAGDQANATMDVLRAERLRAITLTASVLAGLVMITLMGITRSTRSMIEPLHRLAARARAVSAGELGHGDLVLSGPTEVQEVTAAFNDMTANLRGVRNLLARASDGPIDDRVELPGDLGVELSRSLNRLRDTMDELRSVREQLAHEAAHDPLTGLANRNEAMRWLDDATKAGSAGHVGVLFVDLDRFKGVNDGFGHDAGDEVLRVVAGRLRSSTRSGDLVARFGGDEFVLAFDTGAGRDGDLDESGRVLNVVPDVDAARRRAEQLAERVLAGVLTPIATASGEHRVGASIGLCVRTKDHHRCAPRELLADADAACYRAKGAGGEGIAHAAEPTATAAAVPDGSASEDRRLESAG